MNGNVIITGAGLVGSLLSIFLAKRGCQVTVYEKRGDLRSGNMGDGRSINLALSDRGLNALEKVDLRDKVLEQVIPMHGRMIHDLHGSQQLQPYGNEGQAIHSISRENLNILLVNEAEKKGVEFTFEYRADGADFEGECLIVSGPPGNTEKISADVMIGADGAFSALRSALQKSDRFNYAQEYLAHGYKELTIPPIDGEFAMNPNALHIWPRKRYMLIALPNPDKTFTCTLFFPFEGATSFSEIKTDDDIKHFFKESFPDTERLIPELVKEYNRNPTSSLVTVRCYPWTKGKFLLIGDAAHAIVPFYGQGMNAGFEDCTVLTNILDRTDGDWAKTLSEFQRERKIDTDAIADLALRNFVEMRDSVADKEFLNRKAIEKELHKRFGRGWLPLYSMVTFDDMPYSEALRRGKVQDKIMAQQVGIDCNNIDFDLVLAQYKEMVS